MTRDDIARAAYIGWSRNKRVPPYDDLPSWRRCQWEAAADAVIALLPPLVRPLADEPTPRPGIVGITRETVVERLKRRAG